MVLCEKSDAPGENVKNAEFEVNRARERCTHRVGKAALVVHVMGHLGRCHAGAEAKAKQGKDQHRGCE